MVTFDFILLSLSQAGDKMQFAKLSKKNSPKTFSLFTRSIKQKPVPWHSQSTWSVCAITKPVNLKTNLALEVQSLLRFRCFFSTASNRRNTGIYFLRKYYRNIVLGIGLCPVVTFMYNVALSTTSF